MKRSPFTKYDGSLQMMAREPIEMHEIDFNKLFFLRWTVENWHLRPFEHDGKPASMPAGAFVDYLARRDEQEPAIDAA